MDKDEYYKTVRTARVLESKDSDFVVGEKYPVYMDKVSTFGIFSAKGEFMPLRLARLFGVRWEYVHNE